MEKELVCILVQAISCWMMVGISWFIQVVHYPLYDKIKDGFVDYERSHLRRAVCVLGPLMIIEATTAIWLVGLMPSGILTQLATLNLLFVIAIWLSTFLFQAHHHQVLSVRFSKRSLKMLIMANWIRTIIWTAKGVLIVFILALQFK